MKNIAFSSKRETCATSSGTKSYLPDPDTLLKKQKLSIERRKSAQAPPSSTGSQSSSLRPIMEQTNWFKMPLLESRDAPKFKHTEPSEVRQFLQRMESLFEHAGIKGDKERKRQILEYVDAQTEQEWLGFDSYGDEYTWANFVKEIKDSYPEAVDDVGSVSNLERSAESMHVWAEAIQRRSICW